MEGRLRQDIEAENHQYRVRSGVMKESQEALELNISNMRKEEKLRASRQKKELKECIDYEQILKDYFQLDIDLEREQLIQKINEHYDDLRKE